MKHAALLLLSVAVVSPAAAQTARRGAAPPPASATAAVIVTVTDGKGAPLEGVTVRVSGALDREAETARDGTVRLQGLRAGTYRFRFLRDGSIPLERDVTIAAGQRTIDQHVMLSAAERTAPLSPSPSPAPAPPEPTKPPKPLPPTGKAVTVSLPSYIEQNFISASQPQKVSSVACSGVVESVLWQVRDPWQNRRHPGADAMLYVVGGEGALRMNDRDLPLEAGTFVSVPRGTAYGLTRRGRNPLIVLATLGGEPCAP